MSEIKLGDNPSIDTQLGVLISSFNNLINTVKENREVIKDMLKELQEIKFYQKEQNSNIATALREVRELKEETNKWISKHDDHHGINDEEIGKRIALTQKQLEDRLVIIETEKQSQADINTGRQQITGPVWKFVLGGSGLTLVGAVAGKIGNLLGWW